jgi:hypothetical protein
MKKPGIRPDIAGFDYKARMAKKVEWVGWTSIFSGTSIYGGKL